MSLSWGLPLAFAGLAALLVPLLLHLDRRRSVQLLRFAALRWVAAQARPRRTWRLVEWLLLALRLLLVAVLVAWLAQPWLRGLTPAPAHWIVVMPGAANVPVGEAAAHAAWLAPGFPSVRMPAPPLEGASLSSLLREFDARIARDDTLEVRVPEVLHGLDAAAIELTREVRWVVAGEAGGPGPAAPAARKLALRYAEETTPALRQVRAALAAWKTSPDLAASVDEGPLDKPVPQEVDAVLRLGAPPANEAASKLRAVAVPKVLDLDPATLDAALLQSAEFPRWLHRALFGAPPPPGHAYAAQVAPTATAEPATPPPAPLRPWLAWLAAALFLIERVLANGRRLAGAA